MRACVWMSRTSASVGVCAALVVVAAIATGCQRPIQVQPHVIDDAQLGVRVKTALVNDAQLGARIIEVRVTRGVVTLSGFVGSTAESARAVEIARTVLGVAEVRSLLFIRDPIALGAAADALDVVEPATRTGVAELNASRRRLLAIGASFNARHPSDSTLDSAFRDGVAVEIDNSLAVRPGVSLWLDLNSRAAFNVFTGYVITRPELTFLESDQFTRRALRADTAVFISASSTKCSREVPHVCAR